MDCMNDEFTMLCCRGDKPGAVCQRLASHVLVYINASTFREIRDKPKGYCYHHALAMHVYMKAQHNVDSRLYSVSQWRKIVIDHRHETRDSR